MGYETIIGLEIHVELLTNSKIFCSCITKFGGEPNTHCCPICLGLPGTLPVLNKTAVELAIKTGIALGCNIAQESKMDRKNYFYPDLPKGFQISQYDKPICFDGYIEIETSKGIKKIGIKRIHIEEDAGKSIHSEDDVSLLDYNRAGVPLIEIVTKPDIASSEEAHKFLLKLKSILEYLEVSNCKMEQGSLRCDININVLDKDRDLESNIVELKNLNSFKAAIKAIEYEEKRHIKLLDAGKNTIKETRRWDEIKNQTIPMRRKEYVHDYRYFTEPDIVRFNIDKNWIYTIKETLPELPHDKKKRFIMEYGLLEYDADIMVSSKKLADFFEKTVLEVKNSKMVSNWIKTELLSFMKNPEIELENIKFGYLEFAKLLKLIEKNVISNNIAKKILKEMFETGKEPDKIIEDKGLKQINDERVIKEIVMRILKSNPQSVDDYKNGKEKAMGFLIGQVMREAKGKANPQIVNKIIREII